MALNWSFITLCLALIWTYSTIRTLYQIIAGHEDLNFSQIVSQYGYVSEQHTVETEDGYLLTIFRMKQSNCTKEKKSPVLLMNGLLTTGDFFLDAGVGVGLPYLISDACFDLWVGNVRGTYYGRKHVTLDPDRSKEFWDFAMDEIGLYDVPATIDYVLNHTGVTQLNYIGVSQGAGSFFIMCSERPEYCNKTKVLLGLGPASKFTHTKSPGFRGLTTFIWYTKDWLQFFGISGIFEKGSMDFLQVLCRYKPDACEAIMSFLDAPHKGSVHSETIKVALAHFPAGTSVKNLARFGQSVHSDKFCKFDYGPEKNTKIYGGEPPEYNLAAVTVPSVLIYGKNDGIVDPKDVEWLANQLPNLQELVAAEDPLWNHMDMVVGKNIPKILFPKILEVLQLFNNETTYNVVDEGTA